MVSREQQRDDRIAARSVVRLLIQVAAVAGITVGGWFCMTGTASAVELVPPAEVVQPLNTTGEQLIAEATTAVDSVVTQVKESVTPPPVPPPAPAPAPVQTTTEQARDTAAKVAGDAATTVEAAAAVDEVVTTPTPVTTATTATPTIPMPLRLHPTAPVNTIAEASGASLADVVAPARAAVADGLETGVGSVANVAAPQWFDGGTRLTNTSYSAPYARANHLVTSEFSNRAAAALPGRLGAFSDVAGSGSALVPQLHRVAAPPIGKPPMRYAPGYPGPGSPLVAALTASVTAAMSFSNQFGGFAGVVGLVMPFGLSGSVLMRAAAVRVMQPHRTGPPVSPA